MQIGSENRGLKSEAGSLKSDNKMHYFLGFFQISDVRLPISTTPRTFTLVKTISSS